MVVPYTDAEVQAVLDGVQRETGGRINQQSVPAIDKHLRPLDPTRLNLDQFDQLYALITNAPVDIKDAYDARLARVAESETVDGPRVAIWRATLANRSAQTYEEADRLKTPALLRAVRHPRFGDALQAGKAGVVFTEAAHFAAETGWASGLAQELTRSITPALPTSYATAVRLFAEKALAAKAGAADDRERLRQAAVVYLSTVLASAELSERERREMQLGHDRIGGPAARGELVGRPAPPMTFLWASGKTPPKSLADLRGKVVVLDFWATWCVPCRAAFPKLKTLHARYGDRVVVLGVTSLGEADGGTPAERVAREARQMVDFVRDAEITWRVAFSQQDVFNPDYAVKGLPHVAILDANGVVRHNGLRVEDPDFETKIDELLK